MQERIIIDSNEMSLVLERLFAQVMERHGDMENVIFVGIQRRGVDLAERLAALAGQKTGKKIKIGSLDINLYRDDWTTLSGGMPKIGKSAMPCSLDNLGIILVDDVLFTGRTVRAALEALLDYGRPASVELLALIDRGHRELPICADYVGRKIGTDKNGHVDVLFEGRDGIDAVRISVAAGS